jgi:hypothetical protein
VVFDTFFPLNEGSERFLIREFDVDTDKAEDIIGLTLLQPLSRIIDDTEFINFFAEQVFQPQFVEGHMYVLNETYVVVQGHAPTNSSFIHDYCTISRCGVFPFATMWDSEVSRLECVALVNLPEIPHLRFQHPRVMMLHAKQPHSQHIPTEVCVFIGPFTRNSY